jgi:hypothetical protein
VSECESNERSWLLLLLVVCSFCCVPSLCLSPSLTHSLTHSKAFDLPVPAHLHSCTPRPCCGSESPTQGVCPHSLTHSLTHSLHSPHCSTLEDPMSDKAKKRRLDNTTVRALAPHSLTRSLTHSLTHWPLPCRRWRVPSCSAPSPSGWARRLRSTPRTAGVSSCADPTTRT